jgi:hypothetical protein
MSYFDHNCLKKLLPLFIGIELFLYRNPVTFVAGVAGAAVHDISAFHLEADACCTSSIF